MRHLVIWLVAFQVATLLPACSSKESDTTAPPPSIATVDPNSGPTAGQTAVTIFGANFQSGATVQFGSAQATGVTFSEASSLSALTPAGLAEAVDVTVRNPDGQVAVLTRGFSYIAPVACAVPTAITSNMTLDPSCVWTVTDTVVVGGPSSPVLTVLPGTTVLFAPNLNGFLTAALQVGVAQPGSLVANGTSTAGITFTSASAAPAAGDWGGIVIGPGSAGTSFQYASILYAGGPGANDIEDDAALTLEGGDIVGGSQSPAPTLANVTISNSAAHGLVFAGVSTGFGQSSGNIQIENWELSSHFPVVIEANEAGTLPTTLSLTPATGPTSVVALNSYAGGDCNVTSSTTWPAMPYPYLSVANIIVSPLSASDPSVTLTIAPNIIQFSSGVELDVDPNLYGTGFLQANGTSSHQISFTTNQATPTAGAWGGVNFWCVGNAQFSNSSLTYASIQWATSANQANNDTGEVAVLNGTASPTGLQGPVIANCSFDGYSDYGIAMVDVDNTTYNSYVANNTFGTSKKVVLYCTGLITDGSCNSAP